MSDITSDIFRGYYLELTRYLRRRLGCASDAEDMAQEAFLRLSTNTELASSTHAKAFVFCVAANLATDELRKRGVRSRAEVIDIASHATGTHHPLPEDILQSRARLEVLRSAIYSLPPKCRHVFLLHKVDGLSHREIADLCGISINAVEAHVRRGLAHCRKIDQQFLSDAVVAAPSQRMG